MALQLIFDVTDKATPQAKKLQNQLKNLNTTVGKTESTFLGFDKSLVKVAGGFLAVDRALDLSRKFIDTADTASLLNSRLNLVTDSTQEFVKAQTELFNISQDTRAGLEGTVDLYTRIARSTKDYNIEQEELLRLTKTINQAITISGGDAQSAQAAIVQLGQAFSANFQAVGQELASLREQAPRVYEAILEGTGTTSKEFKQLAEDGALSSEIIIEALQNQAQSVNAEFGQITQTVGQSVVQVENSFTKLVGVINEEIGLTDALSQNISEFSGLITDNQEQIVEFAVTAGAVIGKTVDGLQLAFDAVGSVAVGIVGSVNTVVYGALRPIIALIDNVAQGLDALGIVSGDTVSRIQELRKEIENNYKFALTGFDFAINNTKDSLEDFSITISERVQNSKLDSEINKIEKEFGKLNVTAVETSKIVNNLGKGSKTQKAFRVDPITKFLNQQKAEAEKFTADLENFGLTQSEVEKKRLMEDFKIFEGYIDKKSVAYQNYTKQIMELDKQIVEEHKQRQVEKLQEESTFTSGATAGLVELKNSVNDNFGAGKAIVSNFATSSTDAIMEFARTGKLSFSDFATSIINDIARIMIQRQISGLLASFLPFGGGGGSANANGGFLSPAPTKNFAKGGLLTGGSGVRDDLYMGSVSGTRVFAMGGEFFTRRDSVNPETRPMLEYINENGSVPSTGGGNVNIVINNNADTSVQATERRDSQGNIEILVDIVEKKLTSGAKQGTSEFTDVLSQIFSLQRGSR